MSKILYVQIAPVGLHQAQPGDNGSTLKYNGLDTRVLKYTAALSTNNDPDDRPGSRFDFEEFTVVGVTFAQQNTQQLGTFNAETGSQQYQIWHTVVVPDNFVLPTPADLTVTLKGMSPTTGLLPSTPLKIDLTISNTGTTAANSTVGIYVSDDAIIDKNDVLVIASSLGTLDGKSSQTVTWTGTINDFGQAIGGGKHYIGAIVDYNNGVAESNEGNNVSKAIPFTSVTPAPDLKVALKSVTGTTVASDGTLDLNYTISNAGNANAEASQLTFYLSKDATIDKDDLKWFWGDTLELAAGQSIDLSFDDLGLFGIFPAGKYYVGAIIDSDGEIAESSESNNSSKGIAVTITGSNLDPIATDDVATTDHATPVRIDLLANDSDPNPGDKLSFVVEEDKFHHGSVKINSDKSITYTPDEGFVGIDTFTYTLSDGHGGHADGTIAVAVDWRDPMVNEGILRPTAKVYDWDFSIPDQAVGGTYTFNFEVTKPTTLHGIIDCGEGVYAELVANPSNKAPTLGLGPDRIGSADAGLRNSTNQHVIDDPLMPGKYSLIMTRESDPASYQSPGWVNLWLSADEAGNRIEWATPVNVGATTKAMVNVIDNKDIFKFTLTEQSSVLVSLAADGLPIRQDGVPPLHYEIITKAGSTDYYHVLESHIDAASRYVDSSYTAPVLDDVANTPLAPGEYYVIVYHPADITQPPVTTQDIKYSVSVNAWIDNAANRLLVEDFGAEGPKSANIGDLTGKTYKNHDFLGLADQNDFYAFSLSERATVKIVLTQSSAVSMDLDIAGLGDIQDPEALINAIGEGGGPRTVIVTLDAGLYSVQAYTDTDFVDPAGTAKYGTPLKLPQGGGAFYDLEISSAALSSGKALKVGTANADNYLGSSGDDIFSSGNGHDNLRGGVGKDSLNGGAGNDLVEGGADADILVGGGGVDTLSYAHDVAGVSVTLGAAAASLASAAASKVQIIVTQGGDAEGDQATGFANIIGGSGNDSLRGDSGNNVLEGGKGADILTGGGGFDIVSYASSTGSVTIDLAHNTTGGGDAQGDTVLGFDGISGGLNNDLLIGNGNDNTMLGGAGDDRLIGALGNDMLSGGAGDDTIEGGAGKDIMDGGLGIDTLNYAASPPGLNNAGVTVDLAKNSVAGGDGTGDKISNFENIAGSSGNDTLTGDKNANLIIGGAGNDIFTGGAAADILTGEAGNDIFRYLTPGDGGDTITDFVSGFDKIGIMKSAFGMAAANPANFTIAQYFVAKTDHVPTVAHSQFMFDDSTGQLWFDADGTGAKSSAILMATLSNGATLGANDFELR